MKTKSAYRLPKNIPAEEPSNIPPAREEEPPQPSETTRVEFTNGANKVEPSVAIVSADEYPQPDEASEALKKQLAHLQASEQAQREFATQVAAQRAAQMAAPAPTLPAEPAARIALWRQHGLTEDDAAFLEANPELVAEPHLCRLASDEAALHHQRDSDAHRAATLEAFHRLQGQQAQAQPAVADPAGFFEPPPRAAPSPAAPDRSAIVSAPVSRREAGGPRELSPRQVKLSPIEQEIARNLGLSDVAYAEGKIRMMRAKANGDLQN